MKRKGSLFSGRKDLCRGKISFVEGTARVDCHSCKGASDLGDRDCFSGVALRIPPGFDGEIILSDTMDRGYSGPIVDAMTSYSDILSVLDKIIEESRSGLKGRRERNDLEGIRNSFRNDPSALIKERGRLKKNLSGSSSRNSKCHMETLDDMAERAALMIRKLELQVD